MHKDSRTIVPHEEMLFTLAVVIGKALKVQDFGKASEAARILEKIVTEEDITKTKTIMKHAMEVCGCAVCLKMLAKIADIEAKETGESFAV